MQNRIRGAWVLAFILVGGLVACEREVPPRPISYRGEYHYAPGGAYLVQNGVEARLCIQGADMTPAIQPEFAEAGGRSEVVVRGILSKRGSYGPGGICAYELTGSELLGVGKRMER